MQQIERIQNKQTQMLAMIINFLDPEGIGELEKAETLEDLHSMMEDLVKLQALVSSFSFVFF